MCQIFWTPGRMCEITWAYHNCRSLPTWSSWKLFSNTPTHIQTHWVALVKVFAVYFSCFFFFTDCTIIKEQFAQVQTDSLTQSSTKFECQRQNSKIPCNEIKRVMPFAKTLKLKEDAKKNIPCIYIHTHTNTHAHRNTHYFSISLPLSLYIYMYVCVCVFVSVCVCPERN